MKNVTDRYPGRNPEDSFFEADDGLVLKVKAHWSHDQPGFAAIKLTASVCHAATGKAVDHPGGPGGKFVSMSHNWSHQDHSEGDPAEILTAELKKAAAKAAVSWRHHQALKTLPIAREVGRAHVHFSPMTPLRRR